MNRDALVGQACPLQQPPDDAMDASAVYRLPPHLADEEMVRLRRPAPGQVFLDRCHHLRGQRHHALLVALAADAELMVLQVNLVEGDGCGLAAAQAG